MPTPEIATTLDAAPAWYETRTDHFDVVYRPGNENAGDYYAVHLEPLYDALTATFGTVLETPITVRLYPTAADYLKANPMAVDLGGAIANTHRGGREIGVVAAADSATGADGVVALALDNAARYELAHIFLALLGHDRFPAGFQEGVARYMEQPDPRQAAGVARLREALRRNGVPDWSALGAPGAEYLDPPVSAPASLSMAHFLAERHGFPKLVSFVKATAGTSGWRDAMEQTFGESPERLESIWRGWLPGYLDGGWQRHALYNTDLSAAEAQIARGEYGDAAAHLTGALAVLGAGGGQQAEKAKALLAQAQARLAAVGRLDAAYRALEAGDYASTLGAVEQVKRELGGSDRSATSGGALAELEELARRARIGLAAAGELERARRLPAWRLVEARAAAASAAAGFGQLGNDALAAQANARWRQLDARLAPAGWLLLLAGLVVLLANLRWRWQTGGAEVAARWLERAKRGRVPGSATTP